jgi:hypothetical protein
MVLETNFKMRKEKKRKREKKPYLLPTAWKPAEPA